MNSEPYQDLTDEQWSAINFRSWLREASSGRPPTHSRRSILDGIRYKQHHGCKWTKVPDHYGPIHMLRYYYLKWNPLKILELVELLLEQVALQEAYDRYQELTKKITTTERYMRNAREPQVPPSPPPKSSTGFKQLPPPPSATSPV